jgi:PPOX class probable F420-dependent enzyme
MAHRMTDQEVRDFLTGTPAHTGKLATTRVDGRPHVAPIWFALDLSTVSVADPVGEIVFQTGADTLKGRSLRRDGRAALCVDDERPPFTFVTIEGTTTISENPDENVHWGTVIGGRYMGADQAEAFGARNGVPGELLVRLRPTTIVALARIAD